MEIPRERDHDYANTFPVLISIGVCLVEEADDFVSQETNERVGEHGLRDVGVLEVVVRLSDHFQQRRQQSRVLATYNTVRPLKIYTARLYYNTNIGALGKRKVLQYSLPNVGPGADPGVQAVSPQTACTRIGRYQIILLVSEAHACQQLAQGCYLEADRPRFKTATF